MPIGCRSYHAISVVAACASLAACSALERKTIAENQSEAASVKLSVISVAPWEEIVSSLHPEFQIDGKTALEAVLKDNAAFSSRLLDVLSVSLGISSLPAQPERVNKTTTDPDGKVTTEVTQTSPADPAGGPKAENLPGLPDKLPENTLNNSPVVEPMIQYKAAAALLQEVRLLNDYINHAVIPEGYQPYLVRLQLAVLPNRRDQPFDIFSDLQFVPGSKDLDGKKTGEITSDASDEGLRNSGVTADSPEVLELATSIPKVIPLLVTDNLEAAPQSEALQIARSLSFLGAGTAGGTPFRSDLQRLTNELQEAQTRDLNSLLAISQLNDNAIRLRLGAKYDIANRFEMTARTHNITLLVNVPEILSSQKQQSNRRIRVLAINKMRDARTGESLSRDLSGGDDFREDFRNLNQAYNLSIDQTREGCSGEIELASEDIMQSLLYNDVFYGDYVSFRERLKCIAFSDGDEIPLINEQWLWGFLSGLVTNLPVDKVEIDLPYSKDAYNEPLNTVFIKADNTDTTGQFQLYTDDENRRRWCGEKKTERFTNAVMVDNGEKTVVRLPLARNLDPSRLQLTLQVPDTNYHHEFAATGADVKNSLLTANFPSIKAFRANHGKVPDTKARLKARIKPHSWPTTEPKDGHCQVAYIDVHLLTEKKKQDVYGVKANFAPGVKDVELQKNREVAFNVFLKWDDNNKRVAIESTNGGFKAPPAGSGWAINGSGQLYAVKDLSWPQVVPVALQHVSPGKIGLLIGPIKDGVLDKKTKTPLKLELPIRSQTPAQSPEIAQGVTDPGKRACATLGQGGASELNLPTNYVIVMRHADRKPDPADGLTEVGKSQARAIGISLGALGIPCSNVVMSGPTDRVKETIKEALNIDNPQKTEGSLKDFLTKMDDEGKVSVPSGTIIVANSVKIDKLAGEESSSDSWSLACGQMAIIERKNNGECEPLASKPNSCKAQKLDFLYKLIGENHMATLSEDQKADIHKAREIKYHKGKLCAKNF